jgi:hypothetical protein
MSNLNTEETEDDKHEKKIKQLKILQGECIKENTNKIKPVLYGMLVAIPTSLLLSKIKNKKRNLLAIIFWSNNRHGI